MTKKKHEEHQEAQPAKAKQPLIAKRDHVVKQNEYFFDIKKGDDVSHIPPHFLEALKTENVI